MANHMSGYNVTCSGVMNSQNFRPFWSDNYSLKPLSILALQMIFIPFFAHIIFHVLKPLGQPMLISQLLAGIIFGPSVLGQIYNIRTLFSLPNTNATLDTIAFFSSMFYLFKVGVQADPSMIKRSGKKAVAIGFFCYVTSLSFGLITKYYLEATEWTKTLTQGQRDIDMPHKIAVINTMTSFPVIAISLTEMNIINSDLGHLATSSSMITNILNLTAQVIVIILRQLNEGKYKNTLGAISTTGGLVIFYFFIVRSASSWVIRRTPEGKPIKEIYLFCIFVLVLMCGLTSEVIGQNAMSGAFLLGLAIPDGPPLGSALEDKLNYLVTIMFMPLQVGILGLKTDVTLLNFREFGYVWGSLLIAFGCFLGKLVGVGIPALWCKVPIRDVFLLSLIMNIKGIIELSILNIWTDAPLKDRIDIETNTISVCTIILLTGIITPLVKYLYDPSERYLAYKRKSILHVKNSYDFRVVVCVHNEDDVPPMLRVLESSLPTKSSNVSFFLLHLVELVGRAVPLLIAHQPKKKPSPNPTKTERIINAFRKFEHRFQSQVSMQSYSTICPYSSMHNDICGMAVDKRTSLILIPFHKNHKDIDGAIGVTSNHSLKILIKNLLDRAPCTVGILVDLKVSVVTKSIVAEPFIYRIVVLFLGGPDDREALAYAMNLVEHPRVKLTVIRFVAPITGQGINKRELSLDNHVIDHFRYNMMSTGRTLYKEEDVKDGVETSWVIRSMKDECDLIMVGRRQTTDPNLTSGLDEWNECEELGVIGDMLSSPEFLNDGSLLVVQQQD